VEKVSCDMRMPPDEYRDLVLLGKAQKERIVATLADYLDALEV
jgi:hypothetical protein